MCSVIEMPRDLLTLVYFPQLWCLKSVLLSLHQRTPLEIASKKGYKKITEVLQSGDIR